MKHVGMQLFATASFFVPISISDSRALYMPNSTRKIGTHVINYKTQIENENDIARIAFKHPSTLWPAIYLFVFFLFAQHQYSQHFVMWWPNGHWNHVSTYIPSNNKITIMKKKIENKTLFKLLKWNLMFMDTLMAITTDAFALLPTECFIHQHWSERGKNVVCLQTALWHLSSCRVQIDQSINYVYYAKWNNQPVNDVGTWDDKN